MLVSLEREKSRALEELSEQNHKLLNQLQRVSCLVTACVPVLTHDL